MTTLTWLYLPTAFVLGMAHALEPGHSKTLVASYLIGIKGTTKDAVLLGLTVTFTHTVVIFLLALAVIAFGAAFPLEQVEHWLEIVSAALAILILAVGMGKPVLGLATVTVFSVGLALALVGIGIAVCRGFAFFGKRFEESSWTKRLPVVSSAIVTLLGLWMLLRALLGHGHSHAHAK